jgi:adenylylsulfate kinase
MIDVRRTTKRSLVKAVTYRAVIIVLDLSVIYLLTRRVDVALGFMIISNIYTTVAYFVHERVWNKIRWGIEQTKQGEQTLTR